MRIVAFVTDPAVIEKILRHLGLWPPPVRPPRVPRVRPAATAKLRLRPAPPPAPVSESEASQIPSWWDDDSAYSQVAPSGED
jgi:hypothetical protein